MADIEIYALMLIEILEEGIVAKMKFSM